MRFSVLTALTLGVLCLPSHDTLADARSDGLQAVYLDGIAVDLRDPVYSDNVLQTTQGGVITTSEVRIQAERIRYTRRTSGENPLVQVEAEGNLMLEYGDRIFTGEHLTWDFLTNTGTIRDARTGIGNWFLGGEVIEIDKDGTFHITQAYVTTCENVDKEWQIKAASVSIQEDNLVAADNVRFLFVKIPVFWIPRLKANLENITDSPVSYRVGFGGSQGVSLRMSYRVFSWREWQTFLRLDLLTGQGLGAGIETHYHAEDDRSELMTRNYVARDHNLLDMDQETRYRVEGWGYTGFDDGRYELDFQWDWLSDKDMASDYHDRDFSMRTSRLTQANLRRKEENWIANLLGRVRLNDFQTVRQELPSLRASLRPIDIMDTGIISDNRMHVGFIDYRFDTGLPMVSDYQSVRTELQSMLYRPINCKPFTFTPEVGFVGLYYSDSPSGSGKVQAIGVAGMEVHTTLTKANQTTKHVLRPYLRAQYFSTPTASPGSVFIFDIEDGWSSVKLATLGCEHLILRKRDDGRIDRYLTTNIWAHSFIDSGTVSEVVPRVYGSVLWNISSTVRHRLDAAWDIARQTPDHVNWRMDWTINSDLAMAMEYRHRREFSWRKSDYTNFVLDFFRTESELRASPLSDRRDTALLHLYYRVSPDWTVEWEHRYGWNRLAEPTYNEFDVNVTTVLYCYWYIRFAYQHREFDDRLSFNIALRDGRPDYDQMHPLPRYQ